MNHLKRSFPVLLSALAFSGCVDFSAKMNVQSELTVKNHHFLNRSVSFRPGEYDLKLKYHDSGMLEIQENSHKNVRFYFPTDYANPTTLDVKGSRMREDFDIQGELHSSSVDGDPYTVVRSCDYFLGLGGFYPALGVQKARIHERTKTEYYHFNLFDSNNHAQLANVTTTPVVDVSEVIEELTPCL